MVHFLRWAGSVVTGTLTGFARLAFAIVLILLIAVVAGLVRGDGLPANMVLTLDLRGVPLDSAPAEYTFGSKQLTVMDIVLGLDAAGRDPRVKGVYVRAGSAGMPIARAEEIAQALKRLRGTGKFVIVHAQGFSSRGMGDYLLASAANEIWMQPNGFFGTSGLGGGKMFYRGLFDKIGAVPQLAKRAEYKSAAESYMASSMSAPDREQTQALLDSLYGTVLTVSAANRKLDVAALKTAFDASPQFSGDVRKAKLIDCLGFDDDALAAAKLRAGNGSEEIGLGSYADARSGSTGFPRGTRIALINTAGVIVDGHASNDPLGLSGQMVGGDDAAEAMRDASKDTSVKAIVLRVDSPGGSVIASDQILDAVKKAQAAGKPVVVSMGSVAASGGYYISLSANRIVAEPSTITGSIGVYTGKLSYDKTMEKLGIKVETYGTSDNALIDSPYRSYTEEQWNKINHQADVIYADFTGKVAKGRNLPLTKVQEIAKGRVWSGKDAKERGLVDRLGGFWTAIEEVRTLAKLGREEKIVFVEYPQQKGLFAALSSWLGSVSATVKAVGRFMGMLETPAGLAIQSAIENAPRDAVEMRNPDLPR